MQEGGGGQVAAVGGVLGQLGEDHHQLVQQALAGGRATLDEVAPGAGQLAQRLDGLRGQGAGPPVPRQQAPGQGLSVQAVGLGAQPQRGGPGRRLPRVEHHHPVAGAGQGVVQRLPQTARRLQADEQLGRRAPLGQPGAQPGVPRGRRLDLERLLAQGAGGGVQRTHHVTALGDVDPDDAPHRRIQHRAASSLPPGRAGRTLRGPAAAWPPGCGHLAHGRSPGPRGARPAQPFGHRPYTDGRQARASFCVGHAEGGRRSPSPACHGAGGFRAAPSAPNIQGGPPAAQALGRSRGLSTKVHLACDGRGRPRPCS